MLSPEYVDKNLDDPGFKEQFGRYQEALGNLKLTKGYQEQKEGYSEMETATEALAQRDPAGRLDSAVKVYNTSVITRCSAPPARRGRSSLQAWRRVFTA